MKLQNESREKRMKGIILEGSTGSRLYPLTKVTNKRFLTVYAKSMVYYLMETLINAEMLVPKRELASYSSQEYVRVPASQG